MDVLFNQSAEMEANECFYLVPPSTNPALDWAQPRPPN